jgi:hypothetical protein
MYCIVQLKHAWQTATLANPVQSTILWLIVYGEGRQRSPIKIICLSCVAHLSKNKIAF